MKITNNTETNVRRACMVLVVKMVSTMPSRNSCMQTESYARKEKQSNKEPYEAI